MNNVSLHLLVERFINNESIENNIQFYSDIIRNIIHYDSEAITKEQKQQLLQKDIPQIVKDIILESLNKKDYKSIETTANTLDDILLAMYYNIQISTITNDVLIFNDQTIKFLIMNIIKYDSNILKNNILLKNKLLEKQFNKKIKDEELNLINKTIFAILTNKVTKKQWIIRLFNYYIQNNLYNSNFESIYVLLEYIYMINKKNNNIKLIDNAYIKPSIEFSKKLYILNYNIHDEYADIYLPTIITIPYFEPNDYLELFNELKNTNIVLYNLVNIIYPIKFQSIDDMIEMTKHIFINDINKQNNITNKDIEYIIERNIQPIISHNYNNDIKKHCLDLIINKDNKYLSMIQNYLFKNNIYSFDDLELASLYLNDEFIDYVKKNIGCIYRLKDEERNKIYSFMIENYQKETWIELFNELVKVKYYKSFYELLIKNKALVANIFTYDDIFTYIKNESNTKNNTLALANSFLRDNDIKTIKKILSDKQKENKIQEIIGKRIPDLLMNLKKSNKYTLSELKYIYTDIQDDKDILENFKNQLIYCFKNEIDEIFVLDLIEFLYLDSYFIDFEFKKELMKVLYERFTNTYLNYINNEQ